MGSGQLHEHPLHIGHRVTGRCGFLRVGDAPRQTGGDQQKSGLIKRLARRRDLRHDIATIPLISEHLLNASDLTLDLAKSLIQIGQHALGDLHWCIVLYTHAGIQSVPPGVSHLSVPFDRRRAGERLDLGVPEQRGRQRTQDRDASYPAVSSVSQSLDVARCTVMRDDRHKLLLG